MALWLSTLALLNTFFEVLKTISSLKGKSFFKTSNTFFALSLILSSKAVLSVLG